MSKILPPAMRNVLRDMSGECDGVFNVINIVERNCLGRVERVLSTTAAPGG